MRSILLFIVIFAFGDNHLFSLARQKRKQPEGRVREAAASPHGPCPSLPLNRFDPGLYDFILTRGGKILGYIIWVCWLSSMVPHFVYFRVIILIWGGRVHQISRHTFLLSFYSSKHAMTIIFLSVNSRPRAFGAGKIRYSLGVFL